MDCCVIAYDSDHSLQEQCPSETENAAVDVADEPVVPSSPAPELVQDIVSPPDSPAPVGNFVFIL